MSKDVLEEFLLNVTEVIVDVPLFIYIHIYVYIQTTNHVTRWKADSIFALGHK